MSFRISPADVGVPGDLDRCATHQLLQREHGEKSCGPVQFMSEQKHSAVAQKALLRTHDLPFCSCL